MLRLPSYAAWLAQQDLAGGYARYRDSLRLLTSPADGRRFVLKAPAHTAELDHLAEAFPGAVVVQLHRDIVETLASGASLFAVYRSTYSDDVDPVEVGRHQLDRTKLWLRRAVDYRHTHPNHPVTFVDIDYEHLIADPVKCLTAVYSATELAPPPHLDEFVDAYHASHPQPQRRHRYTPEDFGIDPDSVRERFSFLPAP